MKLARKTKGYMMITGSGFLWGSMFFYAQYLLDRGLVSQDFVVWKLFIGFLAMFIYTWIKDRTLLKIDKRGLVFTMFMGLVCHAVYNLFTFLSMEKTSISTAVSLLYTAPMFVMIMSRIFLKEIITSPKIIALIICTIGVFLTVTGGSLRALSFNLSGVTLGLLAGFFYAIMNILSKSLLNQYSQLTILIYTFGSGSLFSLAFSNPLVPFKMEFDPIIWLCIIALGVLPTALSYLLFTTGLTYGVESSKASIIATLEVPVSVLGSYLLFGQEIGGWKIVGIIMVLLSVVLLQKENNPITEVRGLSSQNH